MGWLAFLPGGSYISLAPVTHSGMTIVLRDPEWFQVGWGGQPAIASSPHTLLLQPHPLPHLDAADWHFHIVYAVQGTHLMTTLAAFNLLGLLANKTVLKSPDLISGRFISGLI